MSLPFPFKIGDSVSYTLGYPGSLFVDEDSLALVDEFPILPPPSGGVTSRESPSSVYWILGLELCGAVT